MRSKNPILNIFSICISGAVFFGIFHTNHVVKPQMEAEAREKDAAIDNLKSEIIILQRVLAYEKGKHIEYIPGVDSSSIGIDGQIALLDPPKKKKKKGPHQFKPHTHWKPLWASDSFDKAEYKFVASKTGLIPSSKSDSQLKMVTVPICRKSTSSKLRKQYPF